MGSQTICATNGFCSRVQLRAAISIYAFSCFPSFKFVVVLLPNGSTNSSPHKLLSSVVDLFLISVLSIVSKFAFQASAFIHTTVKSRWQALEINNSLAFLHWFSILASSFFCLKAIRILKQELSQSQRKL